MAEKRSILREISNTHAHVPLSGIFKKANDKAPVHIYRDPVEHGTKPPPQKSHQSFKDILMSQQPVKTKTTENFDLQMQESQRKVKDLTSRLGQAEARASIAESRAASLQKELSIQQNESRQLVVNQEDLLRQISDCSLSALEDSSMTLATAKKILLSIAAVSQAQTFWSERYCLQVKREEEAYLVETEAESIETPPLLESCPVLPPLERMSVEEPLPPLLPMETIDAVTIERNGDTISPEPVLESTTRVGIFHFTNEGPLVKETEKPSEELREEEEWVEEKLSSKRKDRGRRRRSMRIFEKKKRLLTTDEEAEEEGSENKDSISEKASDEINLQLQPLSSSTVETTSIEEHHPKTSGDEVVENLPPPPQPSLFPENNTEGNLDAFLDIEGLGITLEAQGVFTVDFNSEEVKKKNNKRKRRNRRSGVYLREALEVEEEDGGGGADEVKPDETMENKLARKEEKKKEEEEEWGAMALGGVLHWPGDNDIPPGALEGGQCFDPMDFQEHKSQGIPKQEDVVEENNGPIEEVEKICNQMRNPAPSPAVSSTSGSSHFPSPHTTTAKFFLHILNQLERCSLQEHTSIMLPSLQSAVRASSLAHPATSTTVAMQGGGSNTKNVRFCDYDFSTVDLPTDTRPGSDEPVLLIIQALDEFLCENEKLLKGIKENGDGGPEAKAVCAMLAALQINQADDEVAGPALGENLRGVARLYEVEWKMLLKAGNEPACYRTPLRHRLLSMLSSAIRFQLRRIFNPPPPAITTGMDGLRHRRCRTQVHELVRIHVEEDGLHHPLGAVADGAIASVVSRALLHINGEKLSLPASYYKQPLEDLIVTYGSHNGEQAGEGCAGRKRFFLELQAVKGELMVLRVILSAYHARVFLLTLLEWPGLEEMIQEDEGGGWRPLQDLCRVLKRQALVLGNEIEEAFLMDLHDMTAFKARLKEEIGQSQKIVQEARDKITNLQLLYRERKNKGRGDPHLALCKDVNALLQEARGEYTYPGLRGYDAMDVEL